MGYLILIAGAAAFWFLGRDEGGDDAQPGPVLSSSPELAELADQVDRLMGADDVDDSNSMGAENLPPSLPVMPFDDADKTPGSEPVSVSRVRPASREVFADITEDAARARQMMGGARPGDLE